MGGVPLQPGRRIRAPDTCTGNLCDCESRDHLPKRFAALEWVCLLTKCLGLCMCDCGRGGKWYYIMCVLGRLVFFGLHLRHMEVPRLGVELELQLLAYTRATATPDPSCVCSLRHSSQQHGILNPLSEARDQTSILVDTSRVHYH